MNLGGMNKSATKLQSNRAAHESYDPNNKVGGNWVRLEDGTITAMPKVHGVARASSDEQALNEASIGGSSEV